MEELEAEEEAEQARLRQIEIQQQKEINNKRSEGAKAEVQKLKALKEMQKKMGKALVQSAANTKIPSNTPTPISPSLPAVSDAQTKKTVTFAAAGEADDVPVKPEVDWGDLVPGRLKKNHLVKPTLIHSSRVDDTLPMRMNVVERAASKPKPQEPEPDSDDESDIEPPDSPLDEEEEEYIGELEVDELDLDAAEHQREIAREYYKQRSTIGQTALDAMRSHTHEDGPTVCFSVTLLPTFCLIRFCRLNISTVPMSKKQSHPCPNSEPLA